MPVTLLARQIDGDLDICSTQRVEQLRVGLERPPA
jgi:hypothetical protein